MTCPDTDSMEQFRSEIKLLSNLNHPNIVKFCGVSISPVQDVGSLIFSCSLRSLAIFLCLARVCY